MNFIDLNEQHNKIRTKKELIEMLKIYKGILNKSMISYLTSLINLEFPVIRDYIEDNERIALSELEIYKNAAIYNICKRTINIVKQKDLKLSINNYNDGSGFLTIYGLIGKKSIQLFDFNYREGPIGFETTIPRGYKTMNIGEISLYQTLENEELRNVELLKIMGKLEKLYDQKNPYTSRQEVCGGPNSIWDFERFKKIQEYERRFNQLDSKKGLDDDDKKEIEMTKIVYDALLEDYGLTNESFSEEKQSLTLLSREYSTELQKKLVKKMPNIKIENNIKYI